MKGTTVRRVRLGPVTVDLMPRFAGVWVGPWRVGVEDHRVWPPLLSERQGRPRERCAHLGPWHLSAGRHVGSAK